MLKANGHIRKSKHMRSYQRQYLKEMGIDIWLVKDSPITVNKNVVGESNGKESYIKEVNKSIALDILAKQAADGQQPSLYKSRTQIVFSMGNPNADWLVVGEAPDDQQGEPFIGCDGRLLNSMLLAMGLLRDQVFISNILMCNLQNNREPNPQDVLACQSYLRQQIDLIKPKIVLAMGSIAAQSILKLEMTISKMRSNLYQYPGSEIPVIVTYHPAYLLRMPGEKRKAWGDLKFAMQTYKAII